jgi:hypothetical protein
MSTRHDAPAAPGSAARQWHPDADGITRPSLALPGGRTRARAEGWTLRLVRDDLPRAFIQVTAIVRKEAGDPAAAGRTGEDDTRYRPDAVAVYRAFTDPADPAGTETACGFERYDDHPFDYGSREEADAAAREMTQRFTRPGYFGPDAPAGFEYPPDLFKEEDEDPPDENPDPPGLPSPDDGT